MHNKEIVRKHQDLFDGLWCWLLYSATIQLVPKNYAILNFPQWHRLWQKILKDKNMESDGRTPTVYMISVKPLCKAVAGFQWDNVMYNVPKKCLLNKEWLGLKRIGPENILIHLPNLPNMSICLNLEWKCYFSILGINIHRREKTDGKRERLRVHPGICGKGVSEANVWG